MRSRVIGIALLVMLLVTGCSLSGNKKEDIQPERWLKEVQELMIEVDQMEVFESNTKVGFDLDIQTGGLSPEGKELLDFISSYEMHLQSQVDKGTEEAVRYLELYDGNEQYPFVDIQVSEDKTYINIAKAIESLESILGLSELDPMLGMILTMLLGDVEYLEIDNSLDFVVDYQAILDRVIVEQQQKELLEDVLIELAPEIIGKEGDIYRVTITEEHVTYVLEVMAEYLLENPDVLIEIIELNNEIYQVYGLETQEMIATAQALKTDQVFKEETKQEIQQAIEEIRRVFKGSSIVFEIEKVKKGYETFVEMSLKVEDEGKSIQLGVWFKKESEPIKSVELIDLSDKKIVNVDSLFTW